MGIEHDGEWKKTAVRKLRSADLADQVYGRYLLGASDAYRDAMRRRDGSQGAASPVRRIDPATGQVIEG